MKIRTDCIEIENDKYPNGIGPIRLEPNGCYGIFIEYQQFDELKDLLNYAAESLPEQSHTLRNRLTELASLFNND